jgi:hypothetical protein
MFVPACFIVPYCCVSLVQFFFVVPVQIYLFCLLGINKLYIFRTVHRAIYTYIYIYICVCVCVCVCEQDQQDASR